VNLFYQEVRKFKPVFYTVSDIVFALSSMVEQGYSKFLQENDVDLEILRNNIDLEIEERKLIEATLKTVNNEASKRRHHLWKACMEGLYDGKKIYTNKEIDDIRKRIWFRNSR